MSQKHIIKHYPSFKNMKKLNIKPFFAILFTVIILASCKKDKDEFSPAPTITGLEIGSNNSKIGYPGNDIHIEGEIFAPANLASVALEIHPKTGTGWKFEQVYTEGFVGLKNAEFHKHIDIPANAVLGLYHIHIKITDQAGQVTEVESELELKKDASLPVVTGFEVGANATGTDLHMEANVTAVNKIARIVAEVEGTAWKKEFVYTDAAMVGQTTYNFHKHVNITEAPIGHYHVHLKVVDQAGKEIEVEEHFDKK